MNWITTNIRFQEDEYMELKMLAAKRRTSVAKIIRERVFKKKNSKKDNAETFILKLEKLAKENEKYVPKGKSMSELLIEMRYEQ